MGLDCGPKSAELNAAVIKASKTIIWNGPMGVFEMDSFATGPPGRCVPLACWFCSTVCVFMLQAQRRPNCCRAHRVDHPRSQRKLGCRRTRILAGTKALMDAFTEATKNGTVRGSPCNWNAEYGILNLL